MKKSYFIFILFLYSFLSFSQNGFQIKNDKKKIKIPFQIINNLIVIPVTINNVKLNFLLDSGVENTILFSVEETDSLKFDNIQKIKIKGLGNGEPIDALHAKKNKVAINDFIDLNHEIYIILDQEINLSTQLGLPIHGIIGYEFFKNHIVDINYQRKIINIYKSLEQYSLKKIKKFEQIPISIYLGKPYVETSEIINDKTIKTKLLIDSGGSDAIWLFENRNDIKTPPIFFKDFLGRGFSGDVLGKRSRITQFQIGKFKILEPTISFPDTLSIKGVNMVNGRNGSIGGGVLKRFRVVLDYKNKNIYLKKNSNFSDPFNYDMSGLEIQHAGVQWIKEEQVLKTSFVTNEIQVYSDDQKSIKYNFALKPVYEITNVRENSSASLVGIQKGDMLFRINGNLAFKYKLQEIVEIFQSEDGKWITLEIERKNKIFKFNFQLKKML